MLVKQKLLQGRFLMAIPLWEENKLKNKKLNNTIEYKNAL